VDPNIKADLMLGSTSVYRLYGLTYDKVKTIEPEYNNLSREKYEAAATIAA
jgi:hypothetical protein